jgi:hypothetical protein
MRPENQQELLLPDIEIWKDRRPQLPGLTFTHRGTEEGPPAPALTCPYPSLALTVCDADRCQP